MVSPIVIKVSGNHLDDDDFIKSLAKTILSIDEPVVLVHGGGKAITHMQSVMGIIPQYVDGLRVTDAASMGLVEMVLCGTINTKVTRILNACGLDALGLNGADRGLIRAQKLHHPSADLGNVGVPTTVNGTWLKQLLNEGITPVIAPIGFGDEGPLNINADHAAGAIAKAIGASRVIFVSNVAGVLKDGDVIPLLTPTEVDELIENGVISDGMIPKVRTAQDILAFGIPEVVITNLDGILAGIGTSFISEPVYNK